MSRPRPSLFALLTLFVLGLLLASCGPRWSIVHEATPDPFLGKTTFALEPLHFEQLLVGGKSEGEYRSDKSPEQNASWDEDKQSMNGMYQQSVVDHGEGLQFVAPAAGVFIVRPVVNFIEPGFYAAVARGDTSVNLTVQILSPDGQVLDEFTTSSRVAATMTNPSSGGRMRDAGADLGNVVAKYLKHRVFG